MLHNEARKLVLEAWDKTHNAREIAKYFSVNESTVYRLVEERARTGSYETRTQMRGRKTQDTMHMQYMGNVPWMLPRSTRLPEQLFCHSSGLTAVWYILRTKVEQLHSDFVNIWENN